METARPMGKDQEGIMVRRLDLLTLALLATGALALFGAGGPVIGLAVSQGTIEVDRAAVQGNGNLTEGSWVATSQAPARLRIGDSRVTLGTSTKAQVFHDRVVIERGSALLGQGASYRLEAGGLTVRPKDAGAQAIVDRTSPAAVQIAALNGTVHVYGRDGVALADVAAGSARSFEPGAAGSAASEMRGVLRKEKDKYWLKDSITNLQVEVRGAGLEKYVNECVLVQGPSQPSADQKSQIVTAEKLAKSDRGCEAPAAAGAAGKSSGAAKTASVLSHGQKVAIGTAVVAGAGLGIGIPLAVLSR
jgi:hypothetical protein